MTDIAHIRELLAKATPGPWKYEEGAGHAYNRIVGSDSVQVHGWKERINGIGNASYSDRVCENLGDMQHDGPFANVELIITLRNEIGPLLDRVERLEADARRYQYLKEKQAYVAIDPHYRELPFHERTGWTIRLVTGDDSSLDNAIDAALRGKGE